MKSLFRSIVFGRRFRGASAHRLIGHKIPDIVARVLEQETIDIIQLVDGLREAEVGSARPCLSIFC
jgi:hypothetical protein